MEANFDKAFAFVIKWEGDKFECDPDDPGGATKYGICKRSYPKLDIKNLTLDQAKEIYRKDYWERSRANNLNFPMDILVFDTAVNCGVGRATKWIATSPTITDYLAQRTRHYIDLAINRAGLRKFLKGWLNRVADLVVTIGQ